jgi:hypothetical protein
MTVEVFTFGTDCDAAVGAAIAGTAITFEYTDLTGNVLTALKLASIKIKMGGIGVVLCTVNPPAPLGVLDLLTKVRAATGYCDFHFYATSEADYNAQLSADKKKAATTMGAKDPWFGLSSDDLRNKLETALNGGGTIA